MKPPLFHLFASVWILVVLPSCQTTDPVGGMTGSVPVERPSESPPSGGFVSYPWNVCLVTGEGLESKGGSFARYYRGREIKVCCKPCLKAFEKNPDVFLTKLGATGG